MKTSDLKQIMQLAWQFFKQTGYKFSDCLKKAWANHKLKKAMQTQIVRFYFQKVDGSIREAWGTICPELIPQTAENQRKRNETVQVYFDTEVKEFRCFKKFNLIV
ncbi:SH3 beta-barrel fold-containing protein [Capnocytophaga canimorsus]|uniref:SH3 beta-barrel fold-containing protein n=1 Tax=Capnocytophaga canimorsus TaxID=28188 RepID=UPI0037CE148F